MKIFQQHICLISVIAALLMVATHSYGQTDTTYTYSNDSIATLSLDENMASLTPSIPTSPQAEAFKRMGEFKVNNSSGIPDINIPLFEIDHFGYKIPLTLRYEATPLKNGYHYDVFGYGWTLCGCSCVSRTINSQPDEVADFELKTEIMDQYIPNAYKSIDSYNLEYDNFNAVLPDGSSFDFVVKKGYTGELEYIVSNARAVKITCLHSSKELINGFVITDESGVKYTFDVIEETQTLPLHHVSWNLSRIDLPNTSTPILFSYDIQLQTPMPVGESTPYLYFMHKHVYPGYNIIPPDETITSHGKIDKTNFSYKMHLLTNINYGVSNIKFDYTANNQQYCYNHVKSISVTDNNDLVKRILMDYKIVAPRVNDTIASLKQIAIYGNDGDSPLVYDMKYSSIGNMSGTDHWGNRTYSFTNFTIAKMNAFIENAISWLSQKVDPVYYVVPKDSTDYPNPYAKICLQTDNYIDDYSAPASPYSHGVLEDIIYPNGGRTHFEFENHKFITATDKKGNYIVTKKLRSVYEGGGFRIKSITNYDVAGDIANVRTYKYGPTYSNIKTENMNLPYNAYRNQDVPVGYGEPVLDPNILTFSSFMTYRERTPMKYMLIGLSPEGKCENFPDPFAYYDPQTESNPSDYRWQWECTFSAQNFRKVLNGRRAVVYPYITEYYGVGGNENPKEDKTSGKTTYKYLVYDTEYGNDSAYFEYPKYYGSVLSYEEQKYKRDRLLEKCEYTFTGQEYEMKSREKYSYSESGVYVGGYMDAKYQPIDTYLPHEPIWSMMIEHGNFYGYSLLQGILREDYLANDTLVSGESYSYNSNLILNKTSKSWEFGEKEYTYPTKNAKNSNIEKMMLERNLLKSPLALTIRNHYVPSYGNKIDYASYLIGGEQVVCPSRSYNLKTSMKAEPTYILEDSVVSYTLNSHPREMIGKDNVHTFYLWGYNNRYLIAQIQNASYEQVSSAISALFNCSIDELEAQNSVNEDKLGILRSQPSLRNAMVTTFTYQPLIGLTSITQPSGQATYYTYNGLGQLAEEYEYKDNVKSNANKRIIKQYSYHYQNIKEQ